MEAIRWHFFLCHQQVWHKKQNAKKKKLKIFYGAQMYLGITLYVFHYKLKHEIYGSYSLTFFFFFFCVANKCGVRNTMWRKLGILCGPQMYLRNTLYVFYYKLKLEIYGSYYLTFRFISFANGSVG